MGGATGNHGRCGLCGPPFRVRLTRAGLSCRTAAGYRGSITNTPPALLPNTSGRYISSARVGTT